jgi:hypothetical protein
MRQLIGVGTPRGLQERFVAVLAILALTRFLGEARPRDRRPARPTLSNERHSIARYMTRHAV